MTAVHLRGIERALLLCAALSGAQPAAAHIRLDFPAPRHDDDALKAGPCGLGAADARGQRSSTFEPGATVVVRFTETIDHVGFYRVAFDRDGSDAADFDEPDNQLGRMDDPSEESGLEKTIAVTLPDVECDRCALQLIQDMGASGTYFQCADLIVKRGAGNTDDTGARAASADGQGCAGAAGFPAAAALAVLLRRSSRGKRRARAA